MVLLTRHLSMFTAAECGATSQLTRVKENEPLQRRLFGEVPCLPEYTLDLFTCWFCAGFVLVLCWFCAGFAYFCLSDYLVVIHISSM